MASKTEVKKDEKTYTETEVRELMEQMKADLLKELSASMAETKVVQVESKTPQVTMRYRDEVSSTNEMEFGKGGKYGTFYGASFIISVDKSAFVGDFRTPQVQNILKTRELIVLDGLTDEERKQYGVDYSDGEYLEDSVYQSITKNPQQLLEDFPKLCLFYKELVAAKFRREYSEGKLKVSRAIIEKLNDLSKKDYTDIHKYPKGDIHRKGAFYPILEAMNKKSTTD